MMLGTPARLARLILTIVITRLRGANSSIQIAVPMAIGMDEKIVIIISQNVPKSAGRRPAFSAKRDG